MIRLIGVLLTLGVLLSALGLAAPDAGRLPWDDYQELLRWQIMAPGVEAPEREYLLLTTRAVADEELADLAALGLTLVAATGTTAVVRGPITAFDGLGPGKNALPWAHTVLPSIPPGTSQEVQWFGVDTASVVRELGVAGIDGTGEGVTVGVLDTGFTGALLGELGAERVQALKVLHEDGRGHIAPMTDEDFSSEHTHGEMCARAVVSIAPDVNLVLMSTPLLGDRTVFLESIASGEIEIDVLTDSTYNPIPFDHSDGTGEVARAGDAVVESGVFYSYAIGNFGRGEGTDRSFYRATFRDELSNRSHDFTPSAPAGSLDRNTLTVTLDPWDGGGRVTVMVILAWDGWEHQVRAPEHVGQPGYWEDEAYMAVQDIDLYVYFQDGPRTVLAGRSIINQFGPLYEAFRENYEDTYSVPPIEVVRFTTSQPGTYLINVQNATTQHELPDLFERDVDFHLYVHARGTSFTMQHHHAEGSIINMGGAHDVVSVGAAVRTLSGWTVAPYSSHGPTTDGRLKPELLAIAGYESRVQPPAPRFFSGTSAAAPLVAGAAALLLEADPTLTPAELRALLTESTVPLCGEGMPSGPCEPELASPDLCAVWSYAVGCGLLNAEEALRNLETR